MAKEYIEREAARKRIVNNKKWSHDPSTMEYAAELVLTVPAADVIEVVRCKDCRNYKQNPYSPDEDMMCMCWGDWLPTDADDFCSYGERKTEND